MAFANGDGGARHGWELTASGRPYPERPVLTTDDGRRYAETITFAASPPGTYYYLCPVLGHAAAGMWGQLVVR